MADVLIKNMEMPKDDKHGFILVFTKDLVVDFTNCNVIKAIELPPHGDLKDYDFIGNKMSNTYEKNKDKWNPAFADGFIYALKMLDKAPTVLEVNNG